MALNISGDEGSLYWSARIDLSDLGKDISSILNEFQGLNLRISKIAESFRINPHLDTQSLLAEINQVQAALSKYTAMGLDTSEALRQLEEVKAKALQTKVAIPAKVVVEAPDFTELEKLKVRVAELSNELRINPAIDKEQALKQIAELEQALQKATAAGLDTGRLFQQLNEVKAKLGASPVTIPATLKVQTDDASEMEKLKVRIAQLSNQLRVNPQLDITDVLKETREIEVALKKATAGGFDTGRLYQQLEAIKVRASKTSIQIPLTIQAGDTTAFERLKKQVADVSQQLVLSPTIDTKAALAQIEQLEAAIKTASVAGFDTTKLTEQVTALREQVAAQPVQLTVEANTQPAIESIETLRARLLVKQQSLIETTDIGKVATLNKEIEVLEAQIKKTANAGKSGFDELGNKLTQNEGKTNALTKSWGILRTALNIIPGIGLAGFFQLVSDGIIALVTSVIKGKDAFNALAEKMKLYNEVSKEANKQAAGQIVDARTLYNVATNTANAMNVRLEAVKALKAEFPEYFKNISNEAILNGQAKQSYDELTKAILETSRARAAKAKLDEIEARRLDRELQRQKIEIATANELKNATATTQPVAATAIGGLAPTTQAIAVSKKEAEDIIKARKKGALDALDIDEKRDQDHEKFLLKFAGGEAQIAKAIEKSTAPVKEQVKAHERINDLIAKRQRLLDTIEGLRHDAAQSGLLQEASALDAVNEKYDKAVESAARFNAEVDKAKPKDKVPKINIADINALREVELSNTRYRQDAANYAKSLDEQKKAFTEYEEAKRQFGEQASAEMFEKERKGFDTYLDYLKDQISKDNLTAKVYLGIANIGEILKFRALAKEISDTEKENAAEQRQAMLAMLAATNTYSNRRIDIEKFYSRQLALLEKQRTKMTDAEYKERLKHLTDAKADEEKALEDDLVRSSDLFKRLNQDTITWSRDKLKEEIKNLQQILSKGVFENAAGELVKIPPELRKQIEDYIKQLNELDKSIAFGEYDNQASAMLSVSKYAGIASSSLRDMASSVREMNRGLADTLDNLADVTDIISSAAGTMGAALSGDIAGAVQGLFQTLKKEFDFVFTAPRKSRQEAQQQVDAFNARVLDGEEQINALLRERAREQAKINDLRLQGMEAERKLLEEQQRAVKSEADEALRQLQQQSFISAVTTERYGGVLGIGRKTRTKEVLESLAGKSLEEIEKLYVEGKLTEEAQKLYQQLEKLKSEGQDINQALADIAEREKELFTGTTADNITDTIVQGFAGGKRAVQDFADDTKSIIQKALLQALKYQVLQEPIQKIFDQFAKDAQSGGGLDTTEIQNFTNSINKTIEDAAKFTEQVERATGMSLSDITASNDKNNLKGAIKGITEQQAELLAGQFGGQRLATLELVELQKESHSRLNAIEINTGYTVEEMRKLNRRFDAYESGAKNLKTSLV